MAEIDKFLRMGRQVGASDVHVAVDCPPMLRLHGALRKIKFRPLTAEDTKRMFREILTEEQRKHLAEHWEIDVSYETPVVGRCRTNIAIQNRGMDGTFRLIPTEVRSLDELGFPPTLGRAAGLREEREPP